MIVETANGAPGAEPGQALIACDRELKLTRTDPAAAERLGIGEVQLGNDSGWPNGTAPIRAALGRALLYGQAGFSLKRLVDGRRVAIRATARQIRSESGDVLGAELVVPVSHLDEPLDSAAQQKLGDSFALWRRRPARVVTDADHVPGAA